MERAAMRRPLLLILATAVAVVVVRAEPQVPCYFVFGDSLVDNGNNNDIASLARANYPPYGIDFPGGATGRFSNGLTTVDAICKLAALPIDQAPFSFGSYRSVHGLCCVPYFSTC
jgi:hypothetical protein